MDNTDQQTIVSGSTIVENNSKPAIGITNNTMTINSAATIRMGSITLTEDKFSKMESMLEFIERFVQEDERARAIWVAIKTKKRILT